MRFLLHSSKGWAEAGDVIHIDWLPRIYGNVNEPRPWAALSDSVCLLP